VLIDGAFGYPHRPDAEFIDLLEGHQITLLVDVRTRNGSRVHHFDEARFGNLSRLLNKHGISYDDCLRLALVRGDGTDNRRIRLAERCEERIRKRVESLRSR
jgi:uncharacterized protein (DUF488 family)